MTPERIAQLRAEYDPDKTYCNRKAALAVTEALDALAAAEARAAMEHRQALEELHYDGCLWCQWYVEILQELEDEREESASGVGSGAAVDDDGGQDGHDVSELQAAAG